MSFLGIVAVSVRALWGKKSRNLLTMSGVTIGVFALTMIIALGQGLNAMIGDTLANDGNLRQVRVMGGIGSQQTKDSEEVEITGEMPEARRLRLRRSAMNRRRVRRSAGRQLTVITDAAIEELSTIEHVESIQPLVTERYRLSLDSYQSEAAASFGLNVDRNAYRDRIIEGRYFSANDADEVILHEYLLYQWGLITPEQQREVLGKTLTLATLASGGKSTQPDPAALARLGIGKDLSEEEQEVLEALLPKLAERFSGAKLERQTTEREFTVVGVMREIESGEPSNFVEDIGSAQADAYLPQDSARQLFLESSINSELGYASALVIVDAPKNAAKVEQAIKDQGFTAFSVVGVLEQIETSLTIVTVVVAFLTGIALLVSTLGIVNTMITSVLERTREIGIYKAVGASDLQVMAMFLTESALIGFGGGILGLAIAALATIPGDAIAAKVFSDRAAVALEGSVFDMPFWLILGGPLLGTLTAVLAAFLPARRAARVDPVKALRHD